MYISSVHIEGFRSIQNQSIVFEPGLTTFVGENNAGKSSVGLALLKLFKQAASGSNQIVQQDYHYGNQRLTGIEVNLHLSDDEIKNELIAKMIPTTANLLPDSPLHSWLMMNGNKITMQNTSLDHKFELRWGELYIDENMVSTSRTNLSGKAQPFFENLQKIKTLEEVRDRLRNPFTLNNNIRAGFSNFVLERYKLMEEFRARLTHDRTKAVESMTGRETASVLLNLKNHRNAIESARYTKIINTYKSLVPHYDIYAVETEPGSGTPDIQFYETGHTKPISMDQVSAGMHQILTLVTNLIARNGLVLFIEHPENHLHPHSMRRLKSLLVEASQDNQIILVTHDPYFVDPKGIKGLRRFWWIPGIGTQIKPSETFLDKVQTAQTQTVFRNFINREIVFARAVIIVEDESHREFLISVAPILGRDIDASGVSIVFADGDKGYGKFIPLLNTLCIPYICLKDKQWGDESKYPSEQFLSLGGEFEQFMNSQGLENLRNEVSNEVGKSSKARQAGALGERLNKDQIPDIFDRILETAINMATGLPKSI